jgi:O-antigen/teichoic acid export membrane protein
LGFLQKLLKKETLLKNSKYTLSANIVRQISSIIIFLVLPNILSSDDYAQTVFITVLMSFIVLSDFGMSFVYSRKMPSVYHVNDHNTIETYNQTFFWFRLIMSIIGSSIISLVYFNKYESITTSILLLLVNPLSLLVSFFISQYSVRENFKIYKDINIKSSFARLVLIPFSYIFGLTGWLLGQLIASLIVIKTIKAKVILSKSLFDMQLIKQHFSEGLLLLANFFFWNQLLNSGRLFASINFEQNVIAQYGLVSAGYSLLLNLIISVFLPVTVGALKIIQQSPEDAIKQIFNTIIKTSLIIAIVVIISIEIAPYMYKIFFPKYEVNFEILKYQLLSLMAIPLITTLGNIFIGLKNPVKLVIIYSLAFVVSYIVFRITNANIVSGSLAQCVGINFLGLLLFVSTMFFYSRYIDNKFIWTIKLLSIIYLPYVGYFLVRSFI